MKKHFLLIGILLSTIILSSCDKLTQFDIEYEAEATIQSSSPVNLPFNVITPEITSNSTSTFESNNTRKDLVEEILLKQLDMEITSPSNGDFSFVNEIHIFLKADGLEDIEIAYIEDIPDNVGNKISLTTVCKDFKEYIKKDQFQISIDVVTDEVIAQDHVVKIYSVFGVDAEILGV